MNIEIINGTYRYDERSGHHFRIQVRIRLEEKLAKMSAPIFLEECRKYKNV